MSFEPEHIENLVDGQLPIPGVNAAFTIIRALLPSSAEKEALGNGGGSLTASQITQLNGMVQSAIANDDLLVIVDVSTNEVKNLAALAFAQWCGTKHSHTSISNGNVSLSALSNGNAQIVHAANGKVVIKAVDGTTSEVSIEDTAPPAEHYVFSALIGYNRRFGMYVEAGGAEGGFKADSLLQFKSGNGSVFSFTGAGGGLGLTMGPAYNGSGFESRPGIYTFNTVLQLGFSDPITPRVVYIASDRFGVGVLDPIGKVHIVNTNPSRPGLLVEGGAGQTETLISLRQQSSTTGRRAGYVDAVLTNPTDATRTGRVVLGATDYNLSRLVVTGDADGTKALIGFLGATPIAQRTLPPAATDAASTQTLLNAIRQHLIDLGLAA